MLAFRTPIDHSIEVDGSTKGRAELAPCWRRNLIIEVCVIGFGRKGDVYVVWERGSVRSFVFEVDSTCGRKK